MAKIRNQTEKQLANLKRDAGPGRPLGKKNYATIYREALIKLAELNKKTPSELELEILSKGILNARAGDYQFYKDMLDRLYGKATQPTENIHKVSLEVGEEHKERANNAIRQLLSGRDTE